MAPGIVVAIPIGTLAARIGDKRIGSASLVLTGLGGAIIAFVPGSQASMVDRVLAGAGGVVSNIAMTKLVLD